MKLRPVGDHIIVQAVSKEEISQAGIIIPDTVNKERSEKGKVIAVGPGKEGENGHRSEMTIKVGDQVLFKKYAPDEIKIDGEEYLVIRMDDVMAVVEEE
ncbi:MAG: 10 kDa chaperonin [Candidatus Uhrbacteria bacterium GW2011_GWE2_40_58]|nr:MAG: 10 kDa chaperonin [Candidatus Uhrbacteria bacterium GW2011_GWF2_40_263]KKR67717.1 MAG: 10 kDa chaperonin [Candidatus Uhrbacteria bacterium GW2011_GWE2_40_58]OGL93500.1 MAG: co-chaperone GroES [Candidatus Uhrbacteria bacterium RIFOXYA2_FULL_40_9]OGL96633.1 MAG: co-chaperone GroES [Candidatus Uhrbacteria bacterium RIFOXYB2_FULL_41_18]HBK35267.1 co-chaperone GroES [Candidatus Uhrbacteria bacterium]